MAEITGIGSLFCKKHPEQRAGNRFRVKFGRSTRKRFSNYLEAERFLDGLRFQVDQGAYDPRDYAANRPLGFETLAKQWLSVKEKKLKRKSFNNLKNCMNKAIVAWTHRNIKTIGYGEIEDFLLNQNVSDKTRANMKSCLHDFWGWLRKRRILKIDQIPEFPEVSFELGWRKTVGMETQQAILDEIYRISYHINPKIWIGIKWLCTYVKIRPGELINIREKEIDVENGFVFIPHPKEKKPKVVSLLDEDVEIIKSFPTGLPELPFFRHKTGKGGISPGLKFGPKYLYKWWKKACLNLNIEGVDLYGGTRHSSTIAMKSVATPEQIKKLTGHSTNRAFERYFRFEIEDERELYHKFWNGPRMGHQNRNKDKSNILKLKE
jgi:integrase